MIHIGSKRTMHCSPGDIETIRSALGIASGFIELCNYVILNCSIYKGRAVCFKTSNLSMCMYVYIYIHNYIYIYVYVYSHYISTVAPSYYST